MAPVLSAVEETASWTTAKIGAIRALMDATREYVSATSRKIYSRELIDAIVAQTCKRSPSHACDGPSSRTALGHAMRRPASHAGFAVCSAIQRRKSAEPPSMGSTTKAGLA